MFILVKYLEFHAGKQCILEAIICLLVPFLCTYQFSLSWGFLTSSTVIWLCLLLISCLLICFDSINSHTTVPTSLCSQPQRTKSPNTFLLGIYTRLAPEEVVLVVLVTRLFHCCPLILCTTSFVATATWPAASPIYQPIPSPSPSLTRSNLLSPFSQVPVFALRFASLWSFACICLFVDTIWLHCLFTISELLFFFCYCFLLSASTSSSFSPLLLFLLLLLMLFKHWNQVYID